MKGKPTCRIYLLRHGEVANAQEPVFNGHHDVDLSPRGLEQIRHLSDALKDKPIRHVYCSDLKRTRIGARILADQWQLEPVVVPEFREITVGPWDGMTVRAVHAQYPGQIDERLKNIEHFRLDGGESYRQLYDRVVPKFLATVARHGGETIALMAHGGVNRVILAHILGLPLARVFRIAQQFAAVNVLQFYENDAVVELINGHWSDLP
jgi:alpha-ribazole phosphatase/probable phosphoglycerate mutase